PNHGCKISRQSARALSNPRHRESGHAMNLSSQESTPLPQTFEEASDWFVQFRLGDIGVQGREAFNAWLCRSPDHIRAYLQIAQTYVDLPALKGKIPLNVEALLERGRSEANVLRLSEPSLPALSDSHLPGRAASRWRRPLVALAAGVTLGALGIFGYLAV